MAVRGVGFLPCHSGAHTVSAGAGSNEDEATAVPGWPNGSPGRASLPVYASAAEYKGRVLGATSIWLLGTIPTRNTSTPVAILGNLSSN